MKERWATGILGAALLALATTAYAQRPAPTGGSVDSRVEELLKKMTIEEKVGEMTQLTIMAVSKTQGSSKVAHELDSLKLDSLKLDSALVHYNVGSLLNVWDAAFTPQHWQDVITTIQRFAARKRLHIPVIYGIDAVHGHLHARVDLRPRTLLHYVRVLRLETRLSASRATGHRERFGDRRQHGRA